MLMNFSNEPDKLTVIQPLKLIKMTATYLTFKNIFLITAMNQITYEMTGTLSLQVTTSIDEEGRMISVM